MSEPDNFQKVVKNKKIIIPIIQRDYAQGRKDPKAISVRTRLIDEWIDIIKDSNLRMDFNYIYGTETQDVFYPVDGQQRLTSLYLLHWYLAMATDNIDDIGEWQFDYKTRNSASEFFSFLRDAGKSEALFEILHTDKTENNKQEDIRNESWFKTKWENDPTVVSCLNFLCMLSEKFADYEDQFEAFWTRLNYTSRPAVYFTCLNECDDEYAEIDAAKKYTRMNARGKRLTNFENLKAMIDEIEMKHIRELDYCSDGEKDTISWTYDRGYIDCLYKSIQANSLPEKTNAINEESEKWFRRVYDVYKLVIPCDSGTDTDNSKEKYEEEIYKISQERDVDNEIYKHISKYLYMLKAVFEVLCNNENELAFKYSNFNLREQIAFVLFVSKLWDKNNKESDNANIVTKWNQFKKTMDDLDFNNWGVNDKALAKIIDIMAGGIADTENKSVDEYFVCNDFETNSPFGSSKPIGDLKCRIIERKIKSKLILDGAASESEIDEVPVGNRRWGYLYYICGFLEEWDLGDWKQRTKWDGTKLNAYISLIKDIDLLNELRRNRNAKVAFAYASQFDSAGKSLLNADDINACNNEHIWIDTYLNWDDGKYANIEKEKIKQLNHMKVMFDLLIDYRENNAVADKELIDKFVDDINKFFDTTPGYEECWLRFAAKYIVGGRELLDSKLENENGIVTLKSVPVIIKTYLAENGYTYIDKISKLKYINKKSNYFTADENRIQFSSTDTTYTFAPDVENSGKYRHSTKALSEWGWDLSGNAVSRNMDLSFRAYVNLSGIGKTIKNNFWTITSDGGKYTIKVYEIAGTNNCRLVVNVSEAQIDTDTISQIETYISQWKDKFEAVEKEPKETGNYDHWIELWNNDYETAFGDTFIQEQKPDKYDRSGGQRPRKIWSKIISVPALNWSVSTVEI